jgi:hypothetical protein
MKDSVAAMVQNYVTHIRGKFPRARLRPFLFVSHQNGAPLAMVSANKVFRTLRERVARLPDNLSPHLLRYAWKDAFSAIVDRRGTDRAKEKKLRSYLIGWSPTSKTAGIHSRRHVREKADELSLEHQARPCEDRCQCILRADGSRDFLNTPRAGMAWSGPHRSGLGDLGMKCVNIEWPDLSYLHLTNARQDDLGPHAEVVRSGPRRFSMQVLAFIAGK